MKVFYIIILLLCAKSYSQDSLVKPIVGNKTVEQDGNYKVVPFNTVEKVPVYMGCDEDSSNQKLKKCMSDKISAFVSKKFNKRLAGSLNLPEGKVRINVLFKIDINGKVGNILVRAPHPKLEEEAKRVVSKIPDMTKPGMHDGEAVVVPYSLPILFNVENTKKQRRQLKRN